MIKMKRKILLSFDTEEFDIPIEYGQKVSAKIQNDTSLIGLINILKMLDRQNIKATFFVTGVFAKKNSKLIKEISSKHEISSHSYRHTPVLSDDIMKSKQILEGIIGKDVDGIRVPRFKTGFDDEIRTAGFKYNSSINPIYLPGKYNNFFKKRTIHLSENNTNIFYNIPISATPLIRFPLFWLSFKNFHSIIMKPMLLWTLNYDNYLNIFFHSWEFANISKYNKLPFYVRNCSGIDMINKLEKYLVWLNKKATFVTFSEFLGVSQ